jgi:hypothetical protein
MNIPLVHDSRYFAFFALIAEYVKAPNKVLRLVNSVVDLHNSLAQDAVDEAIEEAEVQYQAMVSRFREALDASEQETQAVYREVHSLREENATLLARLNTPDRYFRGPHAVEAGIAFALKDEETLAFIRDSKKINAIKRVRQATNLGLKEAKDAVESALVQEQAVYTAPLAEWERDLLSGEGELGCH